MWGFGLLAFALVLGLALAPAASAKLIVGNKKANKLVGTGKRDDIFGRGGKDVLIGFDGWDRLHGEEGNDILVGEGGNDRLSGSGLDDTLDGGRGNDLLQPGWGTDVVDAGLGDDVIWAGENDGDMDSIDCGPGNDRVVKIRWDRTDNCEHVRRLRGVRPPGRLWVDVLGQDTWNNSVGQIRDILVGLGGDDYLNGHAAADLILGNDGNDALDGSFSPDHVQGGRGHDQIWGDTGHDRLWAGFGFDTLYGDREQGDPNDGRDEIIAIEADGVVDRIDCGGQWDRVVARSNDWVAPDCERVIRIAR
jgi:Ca2+-binding RTX toxin-like protein